LSAEVGKLGAGNQHENADARSLRPNSILMKQ